MTVVIFRIQIQNPVACLIVEAVLAELVIFLVNIAVENPAWIIKRRHLRQFGNVSQRTQATKTLYVFKEYDLTTFLAVKGFHGSLS